VTSNPSMTKDTTTPYGPPVCVHNVAIDDALHNCAMADAAKVMREMENTARTTHRLVEFFFSGEPAQRLTLVHRSWWGWMRAWEGDATTEGDYRWGLAGEGCSDPLTWATAQRLLARELAAREKVRA
jgi:hypothetical protein